MPDAAIERYAALRQKEFQERRAELLAETDKETGKAKHKSVRVVKDDLGDIVGWIADGND